MPPPPNFSLGVSRVLDGWTALTLCLQNSDKIPTDALRAEFRTWLSGAASQWILENADLSVGEVEDFLADVIATDVGDGLSIEDGSLQEVAANIMRFYHMASEKEVAAAVEAMPKPVGAAQCQGQEQQGGQDQGMEMDSEQQQEAPPRREKQEPEVDEDGFVTVTKKGGRR